MSVDVQNVESTNTSNKPALSLSMPTNNIFHSTTPGYFYPTQLSPIYEPDTESVCSSNSTSPVHFSLLTNGIPISLQNTLYNNNNKYVQEDMEVKKDSREVSSSENKERKENNTVCDRSKSDNRNIKSETHLKTSDVINGDESGNMKDSCDEKVQNGSMSFKSVFSAIQSSSTKKLTKFREFQFTNSASNSSPLVPPIVTVNNDAIISSPFKTAFMNQFKGGSKDNSKESVKGGEPQYLVHH